MHWFVLYGSLVWFVWFSEQRTIISLHSIKDKAIPVQAYCRPLTVPGGWGSQISRQTANEGGRVGPTGRLPSSPGNIPGTHFCYRLSRPQRHCAIMSMKNSNDGIGNRTHDPPTCSAVPQPTAPPRTPSTARYKITLYTVFIFVSQG